MKVCILAAGLGSRNQTINNLHKGLLPLGNKAVVSHIIDCIPESTPIVIAVGHLAEQITSFLTDIYPERRFQFVNIANIAGPGSGPGYSLKCCSKYLQEPFVFTSIDTITNRKNLYKAFSFNWVGASRIGKDISYKYCLIKETSSNIPSTFYYGDGVTAFTGIAGVYDYKKFWENLNLYDPKKGEFQVTIGFKDLNFKIKKHTWIDTGNYESYQEAISKYKNDIVANKSNEALFIQNKKVIKFFSNAKKIILRLERTKYIKTVSPKMINKNMYSYDYIDGTTLSSINDERVFYDFFNFLNKEIHIKNKLKDQQFKDDCVAMYERKINSRIKPLLGSQIDQISQINGLKVEPTETLLDKVNWQEIYQNSEPTLFHGDLQPENIIFHNNQFTLIDWRESFGSSIIHGDMYYDLAKLYHGIFISGELVLKRLYDVKYNTMKAELNFLVKNNLIELLKVFKIYSYENNYCWKNISLIGILHYFSICTLYKDFHDGKYGNFLFLHAKYSLTKWQNEYLN